MKLEDLNHTNRGQLLRIAAEFYEIDVQKMTALPPRKATLGVWATTFIEAARALRALLHVSGSVPVYRITQPREGKIDPWRAYRSLGNVAPETKDIIFGLMFILNFEVEDVCEVLDPVIHENLA